MPYKAATKQTGTDRQKHKFIRDGAVVEVATILSRDREEWDSLPESREPEWSALPTSGGEVLAVRLLG